jgi:hypothetical protein
MFVWLKRGIIGWWVVCVRCSANEVDVASVVMCRPEIAFLIGKMATFSEENADWQFDKGHDQGMCLVFSWFVPLVMRAKMVMDV